MRAIFGDAFARWHALGRAQHAVVQYGAGRAYHLFNSYALAGAEKARRKLAGSDELVAAVLEEAPASPTRRSDGSWDVPEALRRGFCACVISGSFV